MIRLAGFALLVLLLILAASPAAAQPAPVVCARTAEMLDALRFSLDSPDEVNVC